MSRGNELNNGGSSAVELSEIQVDEDMSISGQPRKRRGAAGGHSVAFAPQENQSNRPEEPGGHSVALPGQELPSNRRDDGGGSTVGARQAGAKRSDNSEKRERGSEKMERGSEKTDKMDRTNTSAAGTNKAGGGLGSALQRALSIPGGQGQTFAKERPKPNANEVKLLDSANVSHDYFVAFSEVQWISNLSEGDMGEVHRVKWRGLDCAAKTAKGNQASNAKSQLYKDMLKEIYIMSKLGHHPNVVGFFGVSMGPGGMPMILIELINGPTLDHFLASMEGMLPHWRRQRPTYVAWTKGLLKGLSFLHDREPIILHRDLKPGNLLLADGLRTLKIADFGVSRILKRQDRLKRSLTGMTGTRRYMAPEVYGCKQGVYTEKADIYSCTIVIWEMVMGLKPFSDVAPAELAQPKVRERLRPPTEHVEWKELAALIEKGWDRLPENRPSALEMYEELLTLPGLPDPNIDVSPMRAVSGDGMGAMALGGDVGGDTSVPCNCNCSIS